MPDTVIYLKAVAGFYQEIGLLPFYQICSIMLAVGSCRAFLPLFAGDYL